MDQADRDERLDRLIRMAQTLILRLDPVSSVPISPEVGNAHQPKKKRAN